jgi:DNA-binding GntR family transcriptional regulator
MELDPLLPVNKQIFNILQRDIVLCNILPGTALSEKEVSVRFDVSRQPVREAFIKLAESGLIQVRPQRGSFVNKISISHVNNGCFIRKAIECAVVRRAAELATDSQILQLEQNIHQQKITVIQKKLHDFLKLDDEFHQQISLMADCPLAWSTIENIKANIDRVRFMSLEQTSPLNSLYQQHLDIFSAIQQRECEKAEASMSFHLEEINFSVLTISNKNKDWFCD